MGQESQANNEELQEIVENRLKQIEDSGEMVGTDFCFEYNSQIYRHSYYKYKSKKKKSRIKRICTTVPELVSIDDRGTERNHAYHYTIQVYSKRLDRVVEFTMPGGKFASRHSFSTMLLKHGCFEQVEGTADDYNRLVGYMIDKHQG